MRGAPALTPAAPKTPNLSDEDLAHAWIAGDEAAFRTLFDRWRDPVLGYAWRMLRRREEAEEVCVDAFCRIVEGRWQPSGGFRAYIFTVAHRLCLDRIRRRGRWSRVRTLLRADDGGASSPEAAAINDQRLNRLEKAIAALPDQHRAAVLLFYRQEMPSREVADILDMSDQQLRSALSYARRRLRKELNPAEEVSP